MKGVDDVRDAASFKGRVGEHCVPRALSGILPIRLMLRSYKLRDFRCFESFEAEFAEGLNFIVGPNARGKTSLLEAACILLRLQTPRLSRLAPAIQHQKRGFVVDG